MQDYSDLFIWCVLSKYYHPVPGILASIQLFLLSSISYRGTYRIKMHLNGYSEVFCFSWMHFCDLCLLSFFLFIFSIFSVLFHSDALTFTAGITWICIAHSVILQFVLPLWPFLHDPPTSNSILNSIFQNQLKSFTLLHYRI